MTGGLVRVGNRRVQRFVTPPQEVRDGTVRCIACGQIDEAPYHDNALCPATRPHGLAAGVDHEAVCTHADSSDDPVVAMLRDADERLSRPAPDVLGARIGIHAARLAVSSRILDEMQAKATGALAVNFPGIAAGEQLTTPRLAELTDYATAYDAFGPDTPDGATTPGSSPMNPARRFQIVALQELLRHRHSAGPTNPDTDRAREAIWRVVHEAWQLLDDGETDSAGLTTIDQARLQAVSDAMDALEGLVPDSAGPFWGGFPVNYFWPKPGPAAVEAAATPAPAIADPVQAWLQASCVTAPVCAPNARELFPTLFESYCAWCAGNGLTPLLASPFGTALKQYGIVFVGKNNRGQRWRAPIQLKAPPHD